MSRAGKSWGSSGRLLLFLIVLTVFIVLILLQRMIFFDDEEMDPQGNGKQLSGADKVHQLSSRKHMQALIDQTNMLLLDMKHANLSLNKNIYSELKSISQDKMLVERDVINLQKELERSQDHFAECTAEKYRKSLELEHCQDSITESSVPPRTGSITPTSSHSDHIQSGRSSSSSVGNLNPRGVGHGVDGITVGIGAAAKNNKWLVVGIPTVRRQHNEDYLLKVLSSLAVQLPTDPADLMYARILISIVHAEPPSRGDQGREDGEPPAHVIFDQAKAMYAAPHPLSIYFEFSQFSEADVLPDPVKTHNSRTDLGNANVPGLRVRKQTRTIASVLRRNVNRGQFYLFLEDDMEFCPNVLHAIHYLLQKAGRYHPNWLAIRASYGMNGIFMHNRDLPVFGDYLVKHQARRPPDHLVVEWYAGESKESKDYRGSRANIGFRYNLFNHIGVVSTLRSQKSGSFPHCYDMLSEPTVFKVEAYSPVECPRDDIWPCKGVQHTEKYKIDWKNQVFR